jgi:hypothetical protein
MPTRFRDGYAQFTRWLDSSGRHNETVINHAWTNYFSGADNYVDTNADQALTLATLTYTPIEATSVLYVMTCTHTRSNGAGRLGMAGGILRDGVVIGGSNNWNHTAFYYKTDGTNHHRNLICEAEVPANSTTATVFRPYINNSWGPVEISYGWGMHRIEVWEMQRV